MPCAPCSLTASSAGPSALFTAQNFVTIGAVQALHELGLHRSIAIIGFDDVDMATVVEPGLSVVPQRPGEIGRLAGELLLDRIGGYRGPGAAHHPHR